VREKKIFEQVGGQHYPGNGAGNEAADVLRGVRFSFLSVDLSLGVCLCPAVFCGCKGWSPRP